MKITLSAIFSISSVIWDENNTEVFFSFATHLRISKTSSRTIGSNPEVGSSSTNKSGFLRVLNSKNI